MWMKYKGKNMFMKLDEKIQDHNQKLKCNNTKRAVQKNCNKFKGIKRVITVF